MLTNALKIILSGHPPNSLVIDFFIKFSNSFSIESDIVFHFGLTIRIHPASSLGNLAAYEEAMKTMGQSEEEKQVMEKFNGMNEIYISSPNYFLSVS